MDVHYHVKYSYILQLNYLESHEACQVLSLVTNNHYIAKERYLPQNVVFQKDRRYVFPTRCNNDLCRVKGQKVQTLDAEVLQAHTKVKCIYTKVHSYCVGV